jgi:hypothetical protein
MLQKYHLIRMYVEEGEIKLCKIHTDLNVADPQEEQTYTLKVSPYAGVHG